jgi:hypothetical protein
MIQFLRKNQQVFILFIFLYSLVSVFSIYFTQDYTQFLDTPFKLPFLSGIYQKLLSLNKVYLPLTIVVYLILVFSGFYLVRIGIKYLIITHRSPFSALFLVSISSFCFREELFSGASIASLFLLFALERVIGSLEDREISYRFLDAGLILASGSLFYPNLIFLLPFLWISQMILRPANWRELFFTLIGIGIPVLYLVSGFFLMNKPFIPELKYWQEWLSLRKTIQLDWPWMAGVGFYLFMMMVGSVFAVLKYNMTKIQSRKLYQLLFILFINIICIALFVPSTGLEIFFLIAIPSSVLLSIYFTGCKNSFINRLIFFILLAIPIVLNLI